MSAMTAGRDAPDIPAVRSRMANAGRLVASIKTCSSSSSNNTIAEMSCISTSKNNGKRIVYFYFFSFGLPDRKHTAQVRYSGQKSKAANGLHRPVYMDGCKPVTRSVAVVEKADRTAFV